MDMAVPEPRSHNQAFTVNQGRVARDFDRGARSNGKNMAVAYKDCAVFDWRICGRGINLCANQGRSEARLDPLAKRTILKRSDIANRIRMSAIYGLSRAI